MSLAYKNVIEINVSNKILLSRIIQSNLYIIGHVSFAYYDCRKPPLRKMFIQIPLGEKMHAWIIPKLGTVLFPESMNK